MVTFVCGDTEAQYSCFSKVTQSASDKACIWIQVSLTPKPIFSIVCPTVSGLLIEQLAIKSEFQDKLSNRCFLGCLSVILTQNLISSGRESDYTKTGIELSVL